MHISSTSTFCTFKPLQVGRLSLFRTLLFITPLFRISYLLNGTSSGDPTQTCYCIMGFHDNILYVVKMCTISLKIMEVSLWILELFRLKCGWSHCLRTNTVGLFPMLLWCYNQCVWSQQSGRGGGGSHHKWLFVELTFPAKRRSHLFRQNLPYYSVTFKKRWPGGGVKSVICDWG